MSFGDATVKEEPLTENLAGRLPTQDVPTWVEPMRATLAAAPFSHPDWVFERKLDGVRALAFRDGTEVRLVSRNRLPQNSTYPEVVDALAAEPVDRFVVDGEVVAFDGELTSFERLQGRMQIQDARRARASGIEVVYYAFDLLHLAGFDTTRLPLRQRKQLLARVLGYRDPLRYSDHGEADGERLLAEACRTGWEGLIAKDARSRYVPGRSSAWQKLTCVARQELVIGGYTDPQGGRSEFGALLVGYYDTGELVYAGKVGTGFDERTLRRLGEQLRALERTAPTFPRGDPPGREAHWVEPLLVAEIAFSEWTRGGKLRHPRFVGLRTDKQPTDVTREVPRSRPASA